MHAQLPHKSSPPQAAHFATCCHELTCHFSPFHQANGATATPLPSETARQEHRKGKKSKPERVLRGQGTSPHVKLPHFAGCPKTGKAKVRDPFSPAPVLQEGMRPPPSTMPCWGHITLPAEDKQTVGEPTMEDWDCKRPLGH